MLFLQKVDADVVDILSAIIQVGGCDLMSSLDEVFNTISNYFAKPESYKNHTHVSSYLKLFHVFLENVGKWLHTSKQQLEKIIQIDAAVEADKNNNEHCTNTMFDDWLNVLNGDQSTPLNPDDNRKSPVHISDDQPLKDDDDGDGKPTSMDQKGNLNAETEDVPRHIRMVQTILSQSLTFIQHTEKTHQILALECFISGIPLLKDYEEVLLPLIHSLWTPFMEKFRQQDTLILDRCFSLHAIVAQNARDFITKRSLE